MINKTSGKNTTARQSSPHSPASEGIGGFGLFTATTFYPKIAAGNRQQSSAITMNNPMPSAATKRRLKMRL